MILFFSIGARELFCKIKGLSYERIICSCGFFDDDTQAPTPLPCLRLAQEIAGKSVLTCVIPFRLTGHF